MDRILFYEIILFVEEKGVKDHLKMLPGLLPPNVTSLDDLCSKIFWIRKWEIIFNHKFCKAIWGDKMNYIYPGSKIGEPEYIAHIKKMVLQKDPFKYLKKEYKRIK